MYEYEFVNVNLNTSFFGELLSDVFDTRPPEEIITQRAAQGWRYAGYLPIFRTGQGYISAIQLIFERKKEEHQ